MEEEEIQKIPKWEVMYTKHMKQKRKVYHDGFLTFHHRDSSKVMLYDEFMKLLDSKLLKNDEDIVAGGSILFPGFLVDVSSYISHPQTTATTTASYNSPPPTPPVSRSKISKLSPSQKIIRDFKRNQVRNYNTNHHPPASPITPSSSKEWEALYTTQITQKAKKYHDGFLRLVYFGTLSRQVVLYDSSRTQIDKRYLTKDEEISSGESLKLDGHLVDIGDVLESSGNDARVKTESTHSVSDKGVTARNEKLMNNRQRCKVPTRENHLRTDHAAVIGQARKDVGSRKRIDSSNDVLRGNLMKTTLPAMPTRDVNHILSFLKKPVTAQDNIPIPENSAVVERCPSQSSEVIHPNKDVKPNQFTTQLDLLQAPEVTNKYDHDEATKRLPTQTECPDNPPQPETTPGNTEMFQINTGFSSRSNIEMPGFVLEPSNQIPQPTHFAEAVLMEINSPGKQGTSSTHQQPVEKLPETNGSAKRGGSSSTTDKPKAMRRFSGLAGMNRNLMNTEVPVGNADFPSFDLGI